MASSACRGTVSAPCRANAWRHCVSWRMTLLETAGSSRRLPVTATEMEWRASKPAYGVRECDFTADWTNGEGFSGNADNNGCRRKPQQWRTDLDRAVSAITGDPSRAQR